MVLGVHRALAEGTGGAVHGAVLVVPGVHAGHAVDGLDVSAE